MPLNYLVYYIKMPKIVTTSLSNKRLLNKYYYHGIGGDLSKLASIIDKGIVSSRTASLHNIMGFLQGHVSAINLERYISMSKFNTTAFKNYNQRGISLMVPKTSIRVRDFIKGSVSGEVQVLDFIPIEMVKAIYIPQKLYNAKISNVHIGVLEGSGPILPKINSFFTRIIYSFGFEDKKAIKLARSLATIEWSDYQEKIANKSKISALLSKYLENAIYSTYGQKTYKGFLKTLKNITILVVK